MGKHFDQIKINENETMENEQNMMIYIFYITIKN